jgi:uncharacterized coiled-coil protein SlyX
MTGSRLQRSAALWDLASDGECVWLAAMTEAERLTRLEERHAHLQRHQAEQDKVMLELAEEIARLKKEVAALRTSRSAPGGMDDSPSDDRPPHY